jgi:dUTP pyrophosphatase
MTSKDTLTIKVNNFSGTKLLQFGDWVDLSAASDIEYTAGELVLIPLGIAVQLPLGYEAHILPRSSTFKNWGLLHASSGIIDEAYCGDNDAWFFCAYAVRGGKVNIGDRVCQFRLVKKMPPLEIEYVTSLGNLSRGGLGSTGK